MNSPERDDFMDNVSEALAGDIDPAQERRMREMLAEFRKKLGSHPYVRRLERKTPVLSLSRWKLILVGVTAALLLYTQISDSARYSRITAAIDGSGISTPIVTPDNFRKLNEELNRILVQVPDSSGKEGNSL